ncbi:MAG: hypothetical protein IT427_03435 [Pirellulales bacterium]|nr:hypothetical protein [Pirellulales bacterium]
MKHCPAALRMLAIAILLIAGADGLAQTPYTIDLSQTGMTLNHKVFGQAVPTLGGPEGYEETVSDSTVAVTGGASIRGVAGGLLADTYNWKSRTGRAVGEAGVPGRPTLEYLRYARDQQAELFVTVNTRGTGTGISSLDFVWQDTSLAPLTTLAADWVRYTNRIVPQYRQGDTLPATDAALVNALDWGPYDRLLSSQEAPTSQVKYWEIGNEPDIAVSDSQGSSYALTPSEYADRYVAITSAMLAQDSTIKVGPVVKRGVNDAGTGPDPWLLAVLARPDAKVDFISYHPYQNIFDPYFTSEQLPTASMLEQRLRGVTQKQASEYALVRSAIQTNNNQVGTPQRDLNTPAVASEWNVGSSSSIGSFVSRTSAQALGAAETMFTFARNPNILAAHYWAWPTAAWDGTPTPLSRLDGALADYGGNKLVASFSDGQNFRLYTTTDTVKGQIALWGLNFSDANNKAMQLSLTGSNWDLTDARITLLRLAHVNGTDMSLLDSTSASILVPPSIDWIATDLTGQIDLSNFSLIFEDATITLLLVQIRKPGDFDSDGDVDGADFVAWQTNFPKASGATLTQGDADGDGDVDGADFVVWQTNFPLTLGLGAAAVPEPMGLVGLVSMVAPALMLVLVRRLRTMN